MVDALPPRVFREVERLRRGRLHLLGVAMTVPITEAEGEVPAPDDVRITDPDKVPDIFLDAPDMPTDEQELGTDLGISDVDDIPEIPGGDFLNRRSRFDVGGQQ